MREVRGSCNSDGRAITLHASSHGFISIQSFLIFSRDVFLFSLLLVMVRLGFYDIRIVGM